MSERTFGSVEAGGTKFVCAIGTGHDDIRRRVRIPTTTPEETLGSVADFFAGSGVAAVGIAAFGPIELRPGHADFGRFGTTPKSGWSGADLLSPVRRATEAPVALQTDVVGAAMGEWRWGAGRGMRSLVYITVGTGIGGGPLLDGRPLAGLGHAEMGHVPVVRHPDDSYPGRCPFHRDCLEGMASGPALEERWGRPGEELGAATGAAVEMEAHYLAVGLRTLVYTLAPDRIILGGGVTSLPGLVTTTGSQLLEQLAGYGVQPEHADRFVVAPGLGDRSGIAGGFALAESAYHSAPAG